MSICQYASYAVGGSTLISHLFATKIKL